MQGSMLVAALVLVLGLSASAHGATDALIKGTPRSDQLEGTSQDDRIFGFAGDDRLRGLDGYDVLFGGPGDDVLNGNAGKDYVSGGIGDDTMFIDYSDGRSEDFASCGLGDDTVVLTRVPDSARGRVRKQLEDAPSYCEAIRFVGG
jgi:Ca2+-binding RTX toxin-like protein